MTPRSKGAAPFLLDTHIWLWYLVGSDRLPKSLRATIEKHRDAVWVSPVSMWELGLLHERGRIRFAQGAREWIEQAVQEFPVQEAPLNHEVALRSLEVNLSDRDPADRFLAATALVYELTLITIDERMTSARWLPTLSA